MRIINDIQIDISSVIYLNLKNKIKQLKKNNKTLLIKINSHPCAGKTTFIKQYNNKYLGCTLYDFDKYDGIDRTSYMLLNKKENSVLFGSSGYDKREKHDTVIYIYVIPTFQKLCNNIVKRQLDRNNCKGWANPLSIIDARNNIYRDIFINNILMNPLFYSFQEALNFCINIYNE
jgi:hypothetical protein